MPADSKVSSLRRDNNMSTPTSIDTLAIKLRRHKKKKKKNIKQQYFQGLIFGCKKVHFTGRFVTVTCYCLVQILPCSNPVELGPSARWWALRVRFGNCSTRLCGGFPADSVSCTSQFLFFVWYICLSDQLPNFQEGF